MSAVGDVVASVLVLAGALLALLAGIGLHRFEDVFARMHSATKPATLGLVLVLSAAALRVDDVGDVAKLGLVLALQFTTAPVGAHMVGRAAYRSGTELSSSTAVDELAAVPEDEPRPRRSPSAGAARGPIRRRRRHDEPRGRASGRDVT